MSLACLSFAFRHPSSFRQAFCNEIKKHNRTTTRAAQADILMEIAKLAFAAFSSGSCSLSRDFQLLIARQFSHATSLRLGISPRSRCIIIGANLKAETNKKKLSMIPMQAEKAFGEVESIKAPSTASSSRISQIT